MIEVSEGDLLRLKMVSEHHDEIVRQQKEVARLHDKWQAAKDASLAAKKNYDESVNELRNIIAGGPNPQLSLFSKSAPEDWKAISVDRLNISTSQRRKLIDAGCDTLGKVQDLRSGMLSDYPDGLSSLKSFGPQVIAKVEAAMLEFMPENDDEPSDAVAEAAALPEIPEQPKATEAIEAVQDVVAEASDPLDDDDEDDDPFGTESEAEPSAPVAPVASEAADYDEGFEDGPWADGEPSTDTVRIRLKCDVARMEHLGLVKGAEFDAEIVGDSAVIKLDGNDDTYLTTAEYEKLTEQHA